MYLPSRHGAQHAFGLSHDPAEARRRCPLRRLDDRSWPWSSGQIRCFLTAFGAGVMQGMGNRWHAHGGTTSQQRATTRMISCRGGSRGSFDGHGGHGSLRVALPSRTARPGSSRAARTTMCASARAANWYRLCRQPQSSARQRRRARRCCCRRRPGCCAQQQRRHQHQWRRRPLGSRARRG